MEELIKHLPTNVKDLNGTHCITLMTLVGCALVAILQSKDSPSNEVIPDDASNDYIENIH